MVDAIRTAARAEPLGFTTTVFGASQLGVALPPDGRLDILVAACGTQPLWRCIGADAGAPWTDIGGEPGWGTIRPAFGDVNDSALALASFASSVAGYFGDPDISRSRWEADAAFLGWSNRLADAANGVSLSGGSALGTMATRPSALDIAATAGFELATLDAGSERFAPNYPAPEMWLQAVLAVPGGAAAPGDLASDLTEQVRSSGWDDAATAVTPCRPRRRCWPYAPTGRTPRDWRTRDDVDSPAGLRRHGFLLGAVLLTSGFAAACGDDDDDAGSIDLQDADPGDCIVVDMAVSSEKIALLTTLAEEFNGSDAEVDGTCIFVRPRSVSSGRAAELIPEGWPSPDVNGEPPVIWSPAASGWAGIVNERAGTTLAPAGTPFMLTPLVIAMPEPMAEALGWPEESIGFADLQRLANNPEGWGAVGNPEWGPFRIGKTNPNFSTSGLNFTIAEYYAATGKSADLTIEDLSRPAAVEFATDIESSVVHYGDITMTFLNNWFAADARGTSLTYASAVAVEEKSVIDYNRGDPDGVLAPDEELRPPRVPLVAIYPEEGTLYSDNPFIILDTEWVDADERAAAEQFETFVQLPENQQQVLEFGFRPNNPDVALGDPITEANGVDPTQPQAELEVPRPGGARRHPRVMGGTAQGSPRPARSRCLRFDG